MNPALPASELATLISRVFRPTPEDKALGILVDLPDAAVADDAEWAARRALAQTWAEALAAQAGELGYRTQLVLYPNVHVNNGDLPDRCWLHRGGPLPKLAEQLDPAEARTMDEIYRSHSILIALTKFSATAPLKVAARRFPFRAATMPGFTEAMVPALRIDYTEVSRRVDILKDLLDQATGADFLFRHPEGEDRLHLDLRHRPGHASSGSMPLPGSVGNLPSGEAYAVPYEGELPGQPSRSAGVLPVQFGAEVVRYQVVENRAVAVLSTGPEASREAGLLTREPAYGNLAELGLGVLGEFGIQPCGVVLLDEKLGLHIAFGRSDHFGGQVGPGQFSDPSAVVHIDRVYVPAMQSDVLPVSVDFTLADDSVRPLLRDGVYVQGLF